MIKEYQVVLGIIVVIILSMVCRSYTKEISIGHIVKTDKTEVNRIVIVDSINNGVLTEITDKDTIISLTIDFDKTLVKRKLFNMKNNAWKYKIICFDNKGVVTEISFDTSIKINEKHYKIPSKMKYNEDVLYRIVQKYIKSSNSVNGFISPLNFC